MCASVAVRAGLDESDLTVVAGGQVVDRRSTPLALDALARATQDPTSLEGLSRLAAKIAPDASVGLLITGPDVTFDELRRSARHFPVEATVAAIRIDPSQPASAKVLGSLVVISVPRLADIPALLRVVRAA